MNRSICIRYVLIALLSLLSNCSVNRWATSKLADALTDNRSTVFTGEEDIELAAGSLPFVIKLHETLLEHDSTNAALLLATGKLFTVYSQGFVLPGADTAHGDLKAAELKAVRKRCKKLFLRGREYTMRAIAATHPDWPSPVKASMDSLLRRATRADTALLYWCASSWLGAIAADRSDLALGLSVRRPVAMVERILELDSAFGQGAPHELLCAYYAAAPASLGGGEKRSRYHLGRACELAAGTRASPMVIFATSYCIRAGKRDEFTDLLKQALAIDPDAQRSVRLQNMIFRQRAQWYLDHTGELFPGRGEESADSLSGSAVDTVGALQLPQE